MTTTTEPAIDVGKLHTQANELRGAMVEALGKAEDAKVRKLSNELTTINKQILDAEVNTQGDARQAFLESMHDALNGYEIAGLELTVNFNAEDGVSSVVYALSGALFDKIKATVATIERPSSAVKWSYGWADAEDGKRHQAFDFGKPGKSRSTGSNGARSVGWLTKEGNDTTLGSAYDACATNAQKRALAALKGGSATNAHKVKVVTDAGYTKK